MSENSLTTTYALSTMAGFTGLLIAVFGMDVLSQAEINAIGLVLLIGGVVGLTGSMLLDYRNSNSADLGVAVDE